VTRDERAAKALLDAQFAMKALVGAYRQQKRQLARIAEIHAGEDAGEDLLCRTCGCIHPCPTLTWATAGES
jgi:hypothetical protein